MTRRTSRSPALSPPRHDPSLHPAVDESLGLRAAYERSRARTGRTGVARAGSADDVPAHLDALARIATGDRPDEVGLKLALVAPAALDIRTYYEEAALALVDHVPAARQAESWLFRSTEAGRVLIAARDALRDAEYPRGVWFAIVPAGQPGP